MARCMSADSLPLLNASAALAKLPAAVQAESVFDTQVAAPKSMPALPQRRTSALAPPVVVATQAMMVALFLAYVYLAAVSREFANLLPVMAS